MNSEVELSIIVPVFNEEEVLPEFHRRLTFVIDQMGFATNILYVNDGSNDKTLQKLKELRSSDQRVGVLNFTRNFGKEKAMTAGLDHALGQAIVLIDVDLQDPPELIPEMVKYWREGYDMVYAKRTNRKGESFMKKLTAGAFYWVMGRIGRIRIPENVGDFRLLSRRAVDSLNQLRENHRFMKGLFAYIGYPQKSISYNRDPRFAGHTKWNYWRLWNFSLEGITSFSTLPLRVVTYPGIIVALGSFIYGIYIIVKTLIFGDPVQGFPALIVVITFLGGVQLLALGMIGEYLGRVFNETKQRPLYFVEEYLPATGNIRSQNYNNPNGNK